MQLYCGATEEFKLYIRFAFVFPGSEPHSIVGAGTVLGSSPNNGPSPKGESVLGIGPSQ